MDLKEYIVTLAEGVDYDAFWNQIENESDEDGFVPTRRVDIANQRPGSLRNTHYTLNEEEAEQLRSDPRVLAVELPLKDRPGHKLSSGAIQGSITDFDKVSNSGVGLRKNWGLARSIDPNDLYVGNSSSTAFRHTLTGEGVDIVIVDTGIQADHPEWEDSQGVSRLQQIDWYTVTGLPGTMPANHYTDYVGHGTHCAGIAAGRTFGWAKDARIYVIKIDELDRGTDPNSGIPLADSIDLIRAFHNAKTPPPFGYKRPTIVSISLGLSQSYDPANDLNSVRFRNKHHYYSYYNGVSTSGSYPTPTPWPNVRTDDAFKETLGVPNWVDSTDPTLRRVLARDVSSETDIADAITDGVHFICSAGNEGIKLDRYLAAANNSTSDYWNYIDQFGPTLYYNRRGWPGDGTLTRNASIQVGALDSAIDGGFREQKATFSNCGPDVDVYAPGVNIISATSNTNTTLFDGNYYGADGLENTNFKQSCLQGTSQACPQVTGIAATILQIRPWFTPEELKAYIVENCIKKNNDPAPTVGMYEHGIDSPQQVSVTISQTNLTTTQKQCSISNDRLLGTVGTILNPTITLWTGDTLTLVNEININQVGSGYIAYLKHYPQTGFSYTVGNNTSTIVPGVTTSGDPGGVIAAGNSGGIYRTNAAGGWPDTLTWTPKVAGTYFITFNGYSTISNPATYLQVDVLLADDYTDNRDLQMITSEGYSSRGVIYQPFNRSSVIVVN